MKKSYTSRKDTRLIDPTKIGGPYLGTLVWREDIFVPTPTSLYVSGWMQSKTIGTAGDTVLESIGGMFSMLMGQWLPTDGFFYQDGIGAVNPISITTYDQNTLIIDFPRNLEDGELWVIGSLVQFRGSGGQRASDATIAYFTV